MKENEPTRYYFDWAATAIPEQLPDNNKIFGNPSSLHAEGRLASEALEHSRSRLAKALGVAPQTLYFTSGGTESNALVLHSYMLREGKGCLLYSAVEHPSVRENCLVMQKLGLSMDTIGVERDGRVSEESFDKALKKHPEARFAAIMAVNNETGSLMDIKALVGLARKNELKKPIHFHSDLVQAFGKTPIDISMWDLDSASISAHKLGGPRGIGLLYLKKPIESLLEGGEQERGIRPGTENVQGAMKMADLLELRANPETVKLEEEKARIRLKYFIEKIKKEPRCALIPEDRKDEDKRFSPWILQLRFRDIPGAVMVRALDELGFAISTGSACSSSSPQRPVLTAMGVPKSAGIEGIRISQGWSTKTSDFDAILCGIEKVLSSL